MTGAPVPRGCDAVVPYEWTDRGVAQVRIERAPEVGQHIRPAGEDVSEGDLLVETGTIGDLVESLFEPDGFWGRRPWPQD